MRKIPALIFLGVLFIYCNADAGEALFYKEINLLGGYSENNGWVAREKHVQSTSIGAEYFRKFSNEYGDFLTLDIQPRLAYDAEKPFDTAWSVELHNAYLELKLGLGHNIRAGHFDPAFGLEPVVDTHGTLFQTLAMKNIGFKKDWGAGIRGILGPFDYEVAAQLGSGMGIERKDGSYLMTARMGKAFTDNFGYGVSVLYGDILRTDEMSTFPRPSYMDDAVRKKRVGLDGQYLWGPCLIKGEAAFGENGRDEVLGLMLEVDYTIPVFQKLTVKVQGEFWDGNLYDHKAVDSTLGLGVSYNITSRIALRAAYFHDLASTGGRRDRQVYLQLYFFGG